MANVSWSFFFSHINKKLDLEMWHMVLNFEEIV